EYTCPRRLVVPTGKPLLISHPPLEVISVVGVETVRELRWLASYRDPNLSTSITVHALMVKFTRQELVRPDITQFATNFIALSSILQNKNRLKSILKSMFASDERQTSRYAYMAEEKSIEQIILSAKF
ncbi:hypothetical protein ACMD2_23973, partial [Ananas comosus]